MTAEDAELQERLRRIPGVGDLLAQPEVAACVGEFGEGAAKFELRRLLERVRAGLREGREEDVSPAALAGRLRESLERLCRPAGRGAINATGTPNNRRPSA